MSTDVAAFRGAVGGFLEVEPVANTVLLTEAAYLAGRPQAARGARFGWWQPSGRPVSGAFLQAPRHAPVLSRMDDPAAVHGLADAWPDLGELDVDARDNRTVLESWRQRGVDLSPRSRRTLYRLAGFRPPEQ